MRDQRTARAIEILLVEDNEADARLACEALRDGKLHNRLHHVVDGAQAMAFLHRDAPYADAPIPDIVLLDLNLPGIDGREVLRRIKEDTALRAIPVVVLTSSSAESDVLRTYELLANCFITKPVDFEQFVRVVRQIEDFWFSIVRLPTRS